MLIWISCADKEDLTEEGTKIRPWETANMKYSQYVALPPAGNDLSASYGLNHLKGSNCDINPFFLEAFKRDDLVHGVNCLTETKKDSNRAITSTNSNKGTSRKAIFCAMEHLKIQF